MFEDRTDAGEQLATLLDERGVDPDVVLAIPRGALPIGRAVADRLDAPLDVVIASKLGAPGNPELAIGAVSADGTLWRNDDLIERLGVDEEYVERARKEELAAAREKRRQYRADEPLDLEGKVVLVVDDGLATGATASACLRTIREAGAERVLLAVPVGAPDSLARLREERIADEVIAIEEPHQFNAVGTHYRSFGQVTDEEAIEYLEE